MTRGTVLLLLAATGLIARSLEAQDARLSERLDPATAHGVLAELDSARAERLPVRPLELKALEGASKQAPGGRIVAAVRDLRHRLAAAREALGAGSTGDELVAGAAALRAGVDPGVLRRLRRDRRSVAVPLAVLTDLVARGVPVDSSSRSVVELARRRATDAQFLALQQAVEADIAAGIPASLAVSERLKGMPASGPPLTTPPSAATGTAKP